MIACAKQQPSGAKLRWQRFCGACALISAAAALAGCTAPAHDALPVEVRAPSPPSAHAFGTVMVMCYIEPTGIPDQCKITGNTGSPALAERTLAWLQGPNPPHYRPARRNGEDVGAWHRWVVTFKPPA